MSNGGDDFESIRARMIASYHRVVQRTRAALAAAAHPARQQWMYCALYERMLDTSEAAKLKRSMGFAETPTRAVVLWASGVDEEDGRETMEEKLSPAVDLEEMLAALGANGWELVCTYQHPSAFHGQQALLFKQPYKRPKENE